VKTKHPAWERLDSLGEKTKLRRKDKTLRRLPSRRGRKRAVLTAYRSLSGKRKALFRYSVRYAKTLILGNRMGGKLKGVFDRPSKLNLAATVEGQISRSGKIAAQGKGGKRKIRDNGRDNSGCDKLTAGRKGSFCVTQYCRDKKGKGLGRLNPC